jgi:hypothetical protein
MATTRLGLALPTLVDPSSIHWSKLTVTCAVGYLCVVRFFRWRRYNAVHKKYAAAFKARTLTPEEAQDVLHVSTFYDMPTVLNYALAFALFKTYAVVSKNHVSDASRRFDFSVFGTGSLRFPKSWRPRRK